MLNTIHQIGQGYYNELPSDMMPKIARSAIYSFTISYVLHSRSSPDSLNLVQPLLASATAALASLIYALTTPIFNQAFEDNRILFHHEFLKFVINVSLTSTIMGYAVVGKVNLLAVALFRCVPVNVFKGLAESIVIAVDSVIGNQSLTKITRDVYDCMGLDVAPPGSSSTFVSFDLLPWLSEVNQ